MLRKLRWRRPDIDIGEKTREIRLQFHPIDGPWHGPNPILVEHAAVDYTTLIGKLHHIIILKHYLINA